MFIVCTLCAMDTDTRDFLTAWGFEEYIEEFANQRIDSAALALLNETHIKELIKPIGDQAKFLANLQEWKQILQSVNNRTEEVIYTDLDLSAINEINASNPRDDCEAGPSKENCERGLSQEKQPDHCPNNSAVTDLPLYKFLSSSNEGKAILINQTTGLLDNSSRNKLCDLIIKDELVIDPSASVGKTKLLSLANEICQIFPKEHKSTYFIPYIKYGHHKKAAKGKLLNSLYKFKRSYRKSGLLSSGRSSACSSRASSCSSYSTESQPCNIEELMKISEDEDETAHSDIEEKLLWLKNSSDPLETTKEYWKATAKKRLRALLTSDKGIAEYMNEFPALKKPTGYQLIKEDFSFIYPLNHNKLLESFPLLKTKLIEYGKSKLTDVKDTALQNLLKLLSENNIDQEDTTSYVAFSILPHILQPNTIKLHKEKGKGKQNSWRPSRTEVKDGFIIELASYTDLQKTVSDRKEKFGKLGLPCQPLVVAVPIPNGTRDYFVVIDSTYYMMKSIVEAIDCCFKCHHVFNAKYSAECTALWTFIQKAFYRLVTPWDQTFVTVSTLLADLEIPEEN